jgi:succinyl-diaminopimelate desuccinylase
MPNAAIPAAVADILCELIAIPSVNPMGRQVDGPIYFESRLSDWLMQFFQSIGARCERLQVAPGRDNVVARYDASDAAPTLLLDAHQDTVPVEGMTIPPFEPTIADGRITGRGAADVKGGMAAMLHAFRRLCVERPAGSANVILSCTVDEEATTLGIADLVRLWRHPAGRSQLLADPPDAAIVAEPTDMNVVVAHRGVVRFRLHTQGRACHSSEPGRGINAIYRMAEVLQILEEYASHLERTVTDHPLCGGARLSVGRIEGGVSVNIVPDRCTIEVDRRVIPGEDRSRIVQDAIDYVRSRTHSEFTVDPPWLESEPLSNDDNGWLAAGMVTHLRGLADDARIVGVPYGTHASRISAAGVPSIVFGPGSIDQAHTKDESICVRQLEFAAEAYFRISADPPLRPPQGQ